MFPGGALIGCEAGYMNASRIKGSHAAIKTGMLAAEAAYAALGSGRQHDELSAYPRAFATSWLHEELDRARNFKQWFKKGRTTATLMTGIEQWLLPRLGLKAPPWTLHRTQPDHVYLKPAADCLQIVYPKPDGRLTFDRLSSVFISNTNHAEDQPPHLTLKDPGVPVQVNLAKFAGPESRYCPAAVYEFVKNPDGSDRLQINAQNSCTARPATSGPDQNITGVSPEAADRTTAGCDGARGAPSHACGHRPAPFAGIQCPALIPDLAGTGCSSRRTRGTERAAAPGLAGRFISIVACIDFWLVSRSARGTASSTPGEIALTRILSPTSSGPAARAVDTKPLRARSPTRPPPWRARSS